MSLIDLSGKIDSYNIGIYESIVSAANSLGIEFLVVGATARDLMLEWVYNIPPYRRTKDIDLGVRVKDWNQFEELKAALVKSGKFNLTTLSQRIEYGGVHPIDIVPFGEISSQDEIIEWPPDNDVHLNVEGFREAYENRLVLRLRDQPRLEISVASLPSQVVLKFLAWNDRKFVDNKDAIDIAIILTNYGDINEDRLFGEESSVMEEEEFDIVYAGAKLLGLDIKRISSSGIIKKITVILDEQIDKEQSNFKLAEDMNGFISAEFERSLNLLTKVKEGILR